MDNAKLERINFLARKSRTEGLTDAEKLEQTELRNEYREAFKRSLSAQLDNTYIVEPDGTKRKVKSNG
ncbi:MAG: DUF896 domain-containing protein [Oscillospiraceae bacterium]|nr:DUF896 domain-containing protein [Oscillospiraceae bacterium]